MARGGTGGDNNDKDPRTVLLTSFSLYSLQDLPIYSNCVKLWHKQKKTTIDCTCHSRWLRDQLRKQELEDGGIDVPSFEKLLPTAVSKLGALELK
ncbi:uncharacterized protein [Equus przewalskii]|uniref:Uncharacterized protein isoform X2 n=1 Tax=Equus przewalskii TaxID=9798 RepID=A0ABM4MVS1_EQUPR